ncbi:MAG TPA: hypothetical protein VHD36_12450 [Pirellulales bacterium]|nr:hypothetical protein [Pirellulales bacterium]
MNVFDITSRELSQRISQHFGYTRYDVLYSVRPLAGPTIELWAGDWIHPALSQQVDRIREGQITGNIELLLRLMVQDGVLEKGLYRVSAY